MRIESAEITNYRCVNESGKFELSPDKTILVGINEAGKTAILRALQRVSAPADTKPIDWLFDAPAGIVDDIRRGFLHAKLLKVATVVFRTDLEDLSGVTLPPTSGEIALEVTAWLDGHKSYAVSGLPAAPTFGDIEKAVLRLAGAMSLQSNLEAKKASQALISWVKGSSRTDPVTGLKVDELEAHLSATFPLFAAGSAAEAHWDALNAISDEAAGLDRVEQHLIARVPLLVYYSSYFSVRPKIHLDRLAEREESGELDLDYDFGNLQLLKFLGFTARELSDMASNAPEKPLDFDTNYPAREEYISLVEQHERRVTERKRALQTASAKLTQEIRKVWNDDSLTLRLDVDGQFLQTLVEDDLGIPVELDQRSEGFRWLVSFFVVFYAQARDDLRNAILLLDEPGLSLHALKQQEFRKTVSRLAEGNQIIYTTHSPFMVGADELEMVRVVEMVNRSIGTKVHTRLAVDDPKSVYPLQAALGYDLAQSMFTHAKNLVVEGVTDLLYLEALAAAAASVDEPSFSESVAIVPAGSASKVVYFSTVLVSQRLNVAALLDSDSAGDKAADQEALWQLLSTKRILRTGDFISIVKRAEIEDLLRVTLSLIARDELGWDSAKSIKEQTERPIMEILVSEHAGVSKWKLARAFVRWLASNGFGALTDEERDAWARLAAGVDGALS